MVVPSESVLPLTGRIAIVTGAAGRGVGRATAFALARDGADIVVATHRSHEAAEQVAVAVRALGRRSFAFVGDTSRADVVEALVERTRADLGEPGIVVASTGGRWIPRPIEEIPPDEWREAMAEEVDSVYLLARATLPAMRAAGWGRLVTVGGYDAERWTVPPEVGPIDYALGKAARHWLVRTLARHEAAHGITVNAVAPGPITRVPIEAIANAVLGQHDLAGYRRPTQVDVANTIAWLCASPSVTGTIVELPGSEPGAVTL
jgi:NAD(P)-dependent dehydrogenase (short-subunit alcohol dehydrogenase family)